MCESCVEAGSVVLLFKLYLNLKMLAPQTVSAIGVDRRPFHLVGTSLGGILSGLYAATYPEDVVKLSLICPASK